MCEREGGSAGRGAAAWGRALMLNAAFSSSLVLKPGPVIGAYALMPMNDSFSSTRNFTPSGSGGRSTGVPKSAERMGMPWFTACLERPVKLMPAGREVVEEGVRGVCAARCACTPPPHICLCQKYASRRTRRRTPADEGSRGQDARTDAEQRVGLAAHALLQAVDKPSPLLGELGDGGAHLALRPRCVFCVCVR